MPLLASDLSRTSTNLYRLRPSLISTQNPKLAVCRVSAAQQFSPPHLLKNLSFSCWGALRFSDQAWGRRYWVRVRVLFDSVLDELKGCWGSNQKIGFSFSFSTLSDAIIEPEPVQCSGETEIFIDIIYSPRSSRPFNCHQKRTFVLCVSFTVSDSVFLSLSPPCPPGLSPPSILPCWAPQR